MVEATALGLDVFGRARDERNRAILSHFRCLDDSDLLLLGGAIGALERLVDTFDELRPGAAAFVEVPR